MGRPFSSRPAFLPEPGPPEPGAVRRFPCGVQWARGFSHTVQEGKGETALPLNANSPIPLYHQLKSDLAARIAGGEWRPDEPIPSERELIERYGVSRTTVRQAISDLVAAGLLYRVQGRGTFVAPPHIVQTLAELTGFAEELRLRGLDPDVRVLDAHDAPLPPEPARALGMAPGEPAWRVRRVVSVDRSPLFVDDSYFHPELRDALSGRDVAGTSFYALLESKGWVIVRGEQRIAATLLDEAAAGLLRVPPGAPALAITRVTFAEGDRPVEWARALYRADRYQYLVELRRRAR
ncbi:GntR family transcriptional regulator [Caldinitratiruptor microaerophilus]|uniref:GntR family transcriptional regulator n=1 Tax=Caldinitratiruptor microaerophilus TaxID=671077 RepID=UPI0022317A17|nr:GntR family transcriptional regulator [Caldinitratiruptor microaerophilus]